MPLRFPTEAHQRAAEIAADYFRAQANVDTVLIVNSCARGQATPESDLDMAILVRQGTERIAERERAWMDFMTRTPELNAFIHSGRFTQIHLDVVDGTFHPSVWDDGGGPDSFEIEVGNRIAYSAPFGEVGPYFRSLQARWLPYYDENLRQQRLKMMREACQEDLDHVPHYVGRSLYFQAFDRLYKGFHEYLQALFVSWRTYPLAYNKWIREQVENWLGLPELYQDLTRILAVSNFESNEIAQRAAHLERLLNAL